LHTRPQGSRGGVLGSTELLPWLRAEKYPAKQSSQEALLAGRCLMTSDATVETRGLKATNASAHATPFPDKCGDSRRLNNSR
jgi:hypothetical protein